MVGKAAWTRLRAIERRYSPPLRITITRSLISPPTHAGGDPINEGVCVRDTCGLDGPKVSEFWHPADTQAADLPPLDDADIAQFHSIVAANADAWDEWQLPQIWRNAPGGPVLAVQSWRKGADNHALPDGLQIESIRPLW